MLLGFEASLRLVVLGKRYWLSVNLSYALADTRDLKSQRFPTFEPLDSYPHDGPVGPLVRP
jgi:hypothetical protein